MKTASIAVAIFWLALSGFAMFTDSEVFAAAYLVLSGVWVAAWNVMLYIDEQKHNSDGREH